MDLKKITTFFVFLLALHNNLVTRCVIYNKWKRLPRRRWWVRPVNRSRMAQGFYDNLVEELLAEDHEEFFSLFRMWPEQFESLVNLVAPHLKKSSIRKPLPTKLRVAVTLMYLSQGGTTRQQHAEFRIGKSTVNKVVNETCRAIVKALSPVVLKFPEKDGWKKIAEDFMTLWQFPNCVGAIDEKHMRIQAPPNSGSQYHNYKGFFSMILLAGCDAQYKFTWIDVGQYGSFGDRGVWASSEFAADLKGGAMDLPDPCPLPGMNVPFPHVFIGDEAFPIGHHVMRPYPRRELEDEHRIFNYRLSRARRMIENAFGILAARWQILHRNLRMSEQNAETLFEALCCLHNFIMMGEEEQSPQDRQYCPPTLVDRQQQDGSISEGEWRQTVSAHFKDMGRLGANRGDYVAYGMRDYLKHYFNSDIGYGQCPWQAAYALRGHNPMNV